jgi:Bacterial Ig domain
MHRLVILSLLIFGSMLISTRGVSAQTEPGKIDLRVSRLVGYSSGTGEIQGLFTLKLTGEEEVDRVEFFLDGQLFGDDSEAPFELNFSTDAYSLGNHTISARAFTKDGRTINSNLLNLQFVSSTEGMQTALRVAGPLIGITLLALLVSSVFPILIGRRKSSQLPPGALRRYGASGGTICPKCRRPFSLHVFSLKMGLNKLERCPYCGKWSWVRRVKPDQLAAAEAAELDQAKPPEERRKLEEEERLRRRLESSKYDDI